MKILVVADIHYALRQYDWLMAVAPDFDALVIAGDLLEVSSVVDRRAQSVVVGTYLDALSSVTRVIVCSGNHDLDRPDENGELTASWMRNLNAAILTDGQSLRIDRTLVTACPWWDGPAGRARLAEQLHLAAAERGEGRWIWVYHAPPSESPVSWNGRRHHGDTELRALIAQFSPDIVLSGHVHPSPFVQGGSWADRIGETWVFNTGKQIGETPAHIILNLDDATGVWLSMEGREILRLDAPLVRPIPPLVQIPVWLKA